MQCHIFFSKYDEKFMVLAPLPHNLKGERKNITSFHDSKRIITRIIMGPRKLKDSVDKESDRQSH